MAHSHGHQHGIARDALGRGAAPSARYRRPLAIAFCLTLGFALVQVVTGIVTGSLALLSDAGHMATDALGLAMALAAIHFASRGTPAAGSTYGWHRLEILAALGNAALLLGVAGYVVFEAVTRLSEPPEIATTTVLVVGLVGLAVNVVSYMLLRSGAEESINVRGAALEVLADLVGSIGVVLGAVIMWTTGWWWVDPLLGAAIGLFIVPRAWRLGRDALRILLQHAPRDADVEGITRDLCSIDGVTDVHDLHLWTLTSNMHVLTVHLVVSADADDHHVLDRARELLEESHGIAHATLQIEPAEHVGCARLGW